MKAKHKKPAKNHPWGRASYIVHQEKKEAGVRDVVQPMPLQYFTSRGRSDRVGRVR